MENRYGVLACIFLFVVAGCRMASVPEGGEKQGISVAAVRYMASVGGVGAETVEIIWAVH